MISNARKKVGKKKRKKRKGMMENERKNIKKERNQ